MQYKLTVKELMKKEFPLVDVSERLTNCARMIGDNNACLVMDKGNFRGVLTPRKVMAGFLHGVEKIKQADLAKEIGMIDAKEDVFSLVKIMEKNDLEYVLVKEEGNIVGFVTRKELKQISPIILQQILTNS